MIERAPARASRFGPDLNPSHPWLPHDTWTPGELRAARDAPPKYSPPAPVLVPGDDGAHGRARYQSRTIPCRCDVCRDANAAYVRRRRNGARHVRAARDTGAHRVNVVRLADQRVRG